MTVAATAGDQVVHNRGWFIFLSILLIVAGAAAVAFPILSTFAVEFWAAIAFAVAGVAQTIHAFAARSWGGFLWDLLVGLLYLAAGVVLWLNPIAGVVTLTVFLAAVLVVDGVFRSVLAFQIRPRVGWFWLLFGGIVGIVLGVMIWQCRARAPRLQQPSEQCSAFGALKSSCDFGKWHFPPSATGAC